MERTREEWLKWIDEHELLGQCNSYFIQALADWKEVEESFALILKEINRVLGEVKEDDLPKMHRTR